MTHAGSGSRLVRHAGGMPSTPVRDATIPQAMAQVVSRSPRPLTVRQKVSGKSSGVCAALQTAKGTVSCAETWAPLPSTWAAR